MRALHPRNVPVIANSTKLRDLIQVCRTLAAEGHLLFLESKV
jgi:hypothetical protein